MKMILLIMTLLAFNVMVNSQTNTKTDSLASIEKARYLKEDLYQLLYKNVRYPITGQEQNIQGDVVGWQLIILC